MEDGNTGHCIDSDSGTDGTRHGLVHKVRSKVNGQWSMVKGQWSMAKGQWSMVKGRRSKDEE